MPLVWVTGTSGAGKSTVRAELRGLGYVAYDTDEDHLSRYFDKGSGAKVPYPSAVAQRTDEWFSRPQPARSTGDRTPDRCRGRRQARLHLRLDRDENEIWNEFAAVMHLSVDSETIRRRLAQRPRDAFGGTTEELARILEWHVGSDASYEQFGAHRVDATQPASKVVDDLLDACATLLATEGDPPE